jgi:hypothetical protein
LEELSVAELLARFGAIFVAVDDAYALVWSR